MVDTLNSKCFFLIVLCWHQNTMFSVSNCNNSTCLHESIIFSPCNCVRVIVCFAHNQSFQLHISLCSDTWQHVPCPLLSLIHRSNLCSQHARQSSSKPRWGSLIAGLRYRWPVEVLAAWRGWCSSHSFTTSSQNWDSSISQQETTHQMQRLTYSMQDFKPPAKMTLTSLPGNCKINNKTCSLPLATYHISLSLYIYIHIITFYFLPSLYIYICIYTKM